MLKGRTVLLVDDDLPVRKLVSEALHHDGCTVLEAHSGRDAISVADRQARTIDLLLTDCDMPGMCGFDLADHLHRSNPGLPVILMSGSPADRSACRLRGWQFIQKPFAPRGITAMIERTLNKGRDGLRTRSAH